MTKREKLRAKLKERERWLEEAQAAKVCTCPCHEPGSRILHFMGCCVGSGRDIPGLEAEIANLKLKLRIAEPFPDNSEHYCVSGNMHPGNVSCGCNCYACQRNDRQLEEDEYNRKLSESRERQDAEYQARLRQAKEQLKSKKK